MQVLSGLGHSGMSAAVEMSCHKLTEFLKRVN